MLGRGILAKKMKIAIEIFTSLFVLILTMGVCVGIISSDLTVMEARDQYYSYVNELQESNFADNVVSSCIADAVNSGQTLSIDIVEDENGSRSANIVLGYTYTVPVLNIEQKKTISGFIN